MCVHVCALSGVGPFTSSWTATHQAPLSVGFPRQEYWSGLPFPPSGDLRHPRREPMSLASAALAGRFLTNWATREALSSTIYYNYYFLKECTLPYVKQISRVTLVHEAGHPKPVLWDNPEGWGGEGGESGAQDEGDTCIAVADSHWCMAKNIKILLSNYLPIKIN